MGWSRQGYHSAAPIVVPIVQVLGEGGTSDNVLLSRNSRDPDKDTFDGMVLRLTAVASLLYVNRARLGLGTVIAEKRAVFGFELEFEFEAVDKAGSAVPEDASLDQARPMSTRRIIICGEMHCMKRRRTGG